MQCRSTFKSVYSSSENSTVRKRRINNRWRLKSQNASLSALSVARLIFVSKSIHKNCPSTHKSRAKLLLFVVSVWWEYFHTDWVTLLLTCCYGDGPFIFRSPAEPPEDLHPHPQGSWIIMRWFGGSGRARSGARIWSNTDMETIRCSTSSKRSTWGRWGALKTESLCKTAETIYILWKAL